MATKSGTPTHMPHAEGCEFFAEVDKWLKRTKTYFISLADTAGVPLHCRSNVIRGGCGLSKETALTLIKTMEAHPNGIPYTRPTKAGEPSRPRKRVVKAVIDPASAVFTSEAEIQERREQIRREREQRALWHLQAEKPGINGKRAGSMRPVWEMPA
ncbi:hypothetical protein [Blastomonas sp. CCH2-A2]|jgi:hypothetical protein|uniref:hypothetical protein n=1 Tax=Blastomonas sp. CCH2-A2 TaxID=1768788 RepID=UPI000826E54D|nr:hypothetical protein [Blastomonas sp. CCH2-A2]